MIQSVRLVLTAAVAGLGLALAGCGSHGAAAPSGDPSPSPMPPTVVEVTCAASETITTSTTAVAAGDGLHLKVTDRSGLQEVYLNYRYRSADGGAPGGGDPVPAGTTVRVLQVPPGDVSLDCSSDLGSRTTVPVTVRVSDPNGYYRSVTLADLGCSSTAMVSWAVGPARGKTAQAALDALLLAAQQRPGLRARLAPIGYVGSASRTYLIEREGTPWATAVVSSDGGEYVAALDVLC